MNHRLPPLTTASFPIAPCRTKSRSSIRPQFVIYSEAVFRLREWLSGVRTIRVLAESRTLDNTTFFRRRLHEVARFALGINYADEELSIVHAKAGIGCEECHGSSKAHFSDENDIAAPDIMYPMDRINEFCLSCHPAEKLSVVHKPALAATAKEKYCTDCHGQHRLGCYTRHWDKSTGRLLGD